jgi:ATP-dependent Clp protease ATP-binding subunit ClpC
MAATWTLPGGRRPCPLDHRPATQAEDAARTLSGLGVDLTDMRSEVEKIIGFGSARDITSDFAFTPRATHCFELSCVEARTQKSKEVRTEHLLLGIIRDGEGVGARALENLGVSLADIRVKLN